MKVFTNRPTPLRRAEDLRLRSHVANSTSSCLWVEGRCKRKQAGSGLIASPKLRLKSIAAATGQATDRELPAELQKIVTSFSAVILVTRLESPSGPFRLSGLYS